MKITIYLAFVFLCAKVMAQDPNPKSDFLSLCKTTLATKPQSLPLCEAVNQKLFSKNATSDIAAITPSDLSAPTTPIDSKIQFIAFNDPNYLSGIAYCYFVFRNWISPTAVSPDALGMSASGFSILNEDLKKYQTWVTTSVEGKKCKASVEKEAQVSVVNLEESFKGKVALIGLNPYAAIHAENATAESVLSEMKLTINHERIHAYQVACPDFEKWSIKEWESLPGAKKNEYVKKYQSYNWSIPKIAGREYIAFLYESTPDKITEYVKNCKIK
jgi:hypothetical protein